MLSSSSANEAAAPAIDSSTTIADMLQPMLELLNNGVSDVQRGDYGSAHRIFAHLLSSINNTIKNMEQDSAAVPPATVLPMMRLHLITHSIPNKVLFQQQICSDVRALHMTIGDGDDSDVRASAPNQDAFTRVRSLDDAFNCLTGAIIYNLALLHHLHGLELLLLDSQQHELLEHSASSSSSIVPQQGSKIHTLLTRAKMLCGSCLELLPQEATTEAPQLHAAIWNNLAFIHVSLADQALATDCWWQLINSLLPPSNDQDQILDRGDAITEDEAEWVSFYWTNVSAMLWNHMAPAAAAA